ncbi:hypothetical protein K3495_g1986 [Podosphaera aphanis]|nr:hypothetical protein K3495_g1986 [Podosphaera aphanis]
MPVPGQFFPRASSRHRIACTALYRALLKHSRRVVLPSDCTSLGPQNPIKHLIRKRFKQNIKVDSPYLIRNGLKSGYLAEHLLRLAAEGVTTAIAQVHTVLRTHLTEVEKARIVCSQEVSKPRECPRVWPYPGAPKVVDVRPLPLEKISSGRRHVPSLVLTSGGAAFLRFKKPQSPFLSRVLRDKVAQKQKLLDHQSNLELAEEMGHTENLWENKILEEIERSVKGGVEEAGAIEWWTEGWGKSLGSEDQTWETSSIQARKEVERAMFVDRTNAKNLGERLIKIQAEEKRLWELERAERKKSKRLKKRPVGGLTPDLNNSVCV